jgi:hypothetical protein
MPFIDFASPVCVRLTRINAVAELAYLNYCLWHKLETVESTILTRRDTNGFLLTATLG